MRIRIFDRIPSFVEVHVWQNAVTEIHPNKHKWLTLIAGNRIAESWTITLWQSDSQHSIL
jgi:hypothetical protein